MTNGVLPADLVTRNRQVAEAALRPWTPVFTHGDLQIAHVFVDGDEVTGIIDWSEAGQGDALYDLATLTLGHEEHLDDVVAGYGTRRRPRRDPRVVVVAKPAGGPLADRARLRPVRAGLRGRRAEIPDVSRARQPSPATNARTESATSCTAIADSSSPAIRVTSSTPDSRIRRRIGSE